MAKRGRKPKLTDELQDLICGYIKEGNYPSVAAQAAGISESTYYSWMARGRKSKSGKYVQFLEAIKEAESFGQVYHLQKIRKAADDGTWQASAWILERKYPQLWGRNRETVKVDLKGEIQSNMKVSPKSKEELLDFFKEAVQNEEELKKEQVGIDDSGEMDTPADASSIDPGTE